MDPLNIVVMGGGALWLFVTAIREDWKYALLNRIRTSSLSRLFGVVMIAFWTAWIARGAYIPPLADPEAAENKYVRTSWVSPPDGSEFTSVFLMEFGVNKLNSEGVAVDFQFNGDEIDFWCGSPNKTHRQPGILPMQWDRSELRSRETVWLRHPVFEITPRRSLYVCILSREPEMEEPNDIMYFAVQVNQAKGPRTKQRIGHQYQMRQ